MRVVKKLTRTSSEPGCLSMFKILTAGSEESFSVRDTIPIQCTLWGFLSVRFLSLSNFGVFPFSTCGHSGSPFQCPSSLQSAHRLDALRACKPKEEEASVVFEALPEDDADLPAPFGAKPRDKR